MSPIPGFLGFPRVVFWPDSRLLRLPRVVFWSDSRLLRLPRVVFWPDSGLPRLPRVVFWPDSGLPRLPRVLTRPDSRLPGVLTRPDSRLLSTDEGGQRSREPAKPARMCWCRMDTAARIGACTVVYMVVPGPGSVPCPGVPPYPGVPCPDYPALLYTLYCTCYTVRVHGCDSFDGLPALGSGLSAGLRKRARGCPEEATLSRETTLPWS